MNKPVEGYTEVEKRTVMTQLLETLVKATFKTPFDKWDGEVTKQRSGAAMGVKTLARVCTDKWISEFREKMESSNIDVRSM